MSEKKESVSKNNDSRYVLKNTLEFLNISYKENSTNLRITIIEKNDVDIYFRKRVSGIRVYLKHALKYKISNVNKKLYCVKYQDYEKGFMEKTYYVDVDNIYEFIKQLCLDENAIIRTNDNIEFHTTCEIINNYLNTELKSWQRASYPIIKNKIDFWFPKFAKEKDGKLVSQSNTKNWINVLSPDGNEIVMRSDTESARGKTKLVVVFGKKYKENYKFIGVFAVEEMFKHRYVFKKISDSYDFSKNEIDLLEDELSEELYLNTLDDDSLREFALNKQNVSPKRIETISNTFYRNQSIAMYAKRKAKGICQLCDCPAPFISKNGEPYLESHHIVWLSKGGEDTIENTIALCPNCHRKMHEIDDEDDVRYLQEKNRNI